MSLRPASRVRAAAALGLALGVAALVAPPAVRDARALESLPDFTTLVERNHDAVVNISARQNTARGNGNGNGTGGDGDGDGPSIPGLENSPLDELLRRYQEEQRPRALPENNALGSGFIISEDGYVLTNNHVVADADEVLVRLHDRRQLLASVIGSDPRSDVALLKIDGADLPVVSIGDSDALEVGEWVLAIGSPFGFDFSVTAGIVSAMGRSLPNESYVPFIQTDVAINPGNSGGPLFNLEGDVIGINSQIYSRTGSFMGLSFAIPIEMAMDVADQIRDSGRVTRGWLGVIIQEVTTELAESFGMGVAHGALISRILPDSPAADSALRVGDVIVEFEGRRVERSSSLPPLVGRVPANSDATVGVVRDGRTMALEVNIGELPTDEEIASSTRPSRPTSVNPLALTVEPLDERTREALGVDRGGVLVATVEDGGAADEAGVVVGDVILTVDNTSVDTPGELEEILAELAGRTSVAVLVQRESGPVFLALQIDDAER